MDATSATPKLRQIAAVTVGGAAMVLLLLPNFKPPAGLWSVALWNLCHLPAFFAITLMLAVILPSGISQVKRVLFSVLGGVAIALGSEIVQSMTGRSGSVRDLFLDGFGIGFAAIWIGMKGRWNRYSWGFYLVSIGAFLITFLRPAAEVEVALRRQQKRLPDIGTFSHPDSKILWKALGNVKLDSQEGGAGLKISIGKGAYGGVAYRPGMQDWSSFSELILVIRNEGEPFELGIRMDDEKSKPGKSGSWYSTEAQVASGTSEISISLDSLRRHEMGAAIDVSRLTRLVLFTMGEPMSREFIIKSAFLR